MTTDKKIEVPKTRDEINNALLESEIYKVAYRRGVEDGVRGFEEHIKRVEHMEEMQKLRVIEQIRLYLQSLDKGDGE